MEDQEAGNRELQPVLVKGKPGRWISFSGNLLGPGLLACLADADAGCLLVAAQTGARWGYSLLILQVLLIPVLFMVQELTVRLGAFTQKGLTALIRERYGAGWCWFATSLLVFDCIGAMVSEMSGIAAVAHLWGINRYMAAVCAAAIISVVVVLLKYRHIEIVGIIFGLFELTFVFSMFYYHPAPSEVLQGSLKFHDSPAFYKLVAANIGAVIMPWMLYFQQSAVVVRRLSTHKDVSEERASTLIGSVLTQLIMIGALVSLAAVHRTPANLHEVQDVVKSMEPAFGVFWAKVLVSLSFFGGSICAAFVVSLAATWAICEAAQLEEASALDTTCPTQAPLFYGCFFSVLGVGVLILFSGVNVVKLNTLIEVLDAILMPVVVCFLFLLVTDSQVLPQEVRITHTYKWFLGTIFALCSCVSLCSAFAGYA
eukprot:TRINITY_DN94272_c0_g1_i1.p1 TRINITY_DN94272_c0_g1~~TRINITY_DN94272_c0_g1_i1.p1  ORF type:complete len:427 (-),score=77.34 TRINITY_DN94272_c0_g1_i1:164-1444(-)